MNLLLNWYREAGRPFRGCVPRLGLETRLGGEVLITD